MGFGVLMLLLGTSALAGSPAAAAGPATAGMQAAPKSPSPKPTTPGKGGGKPTPAPTAVPTTAPTPTPTTARTPAPTSPPTSPPTGTPRTPTAAPARDVVTGPGTPGSRPPRGAAPVVPATASPTAAPPSPTPTARPEDDSTARRTFAQVGESLAVATRDPQLPLGVLLAVVVFVLVQNRIDRRDPKLHAQGLGPPLDLEFAPPVRRTDAPRPPRRAPRPLLRIVVPDAHHSSPSALPGDAATGR